MSIINNFLNFSRKDRKGFLDRTYAPRPCPPLKSGEGDNRKIVPLP